MLKILDRYIIRNYIGTFLFITLLFSIVAMVVDTSEKIDDYLTEDLTFYQVFTQYIIFFIPHIAGLLFPIYSLIAVVFFTSRLANNTEFIAMIGCGVSFYRLLIPYLIGGSILAGSYFLLANYLIPEGNKTRVKFENTYIWKHNYKARADNIHLMISDSMEVYIRIFEIQDSSLHDVTIVKFKDETIYAKTYAALVRNKGQKKWKLESPRTRYIQGKHETIELKDSLVLNLGFVASDLVRRDNYKEMMTTPELKAYVQKERQRGFLPAKEFEVEQYRRTADAFTILILTIIGFATSSRKNRGGMGINLLVGVVVGAFFVLSSKFSATFAIQGGLSPMLGVWIPNLFFLLVALLLLLKAQK